MAKKKKEDKKYKGGPKRKTYLKNIAKRGSSRGKSRSFQRTGDYSKFGDVAPEDVFTGETVIYRGQEYRADDSTQAQFGTVVWRVHGKEYFRRQGKLYKSQSGAYTEEVAV